MSAQEKPPVLIVAGPTASGKSALAVDIALEFSGTVINADSMQVYEELRILTARPTDDEMAKVPHRLFGVMAAAEPCSAGKWLKMAAAEIEAAWAAKRLPIITGGTGLYIKALVEGLSQIPDVPKEARAEATRLHGELGGQAFRDELAQIDAPAAAIPPGDSQRLIRAYEVYIATGTSLSEWRRNARPQPPIAARFGAVVLTPPRGGPDGLYEALDRRFDEMMAAGGLAEAGALAALNLDPSLPAMKAIGVPELIAQVRGGVELADALEAAKRATRNFAKRQLTWLRHQIPGAIKDEDGAGNGMGDITGQIELHMVSAKYSESLRPEIFPFIRRFLLTG